ncbi:MAG: APC family permease [Candidatus Binatia bacterium]
MAEPEAGLRRVLGAGAITVYAVGDILGAGIYALVGKVAAEAGGGAWISFFVSATLALFTGLTYAELSSRFPVAAGAAAYSRRAFAHPIVSFLVGVFVLVSGVTSAATVSRAFVGYLDPFVTLPPLLASVGLLALMTAINWIGIQESARVNFVLTMIELGGLLLVLVVGFGYAWGAPEAELSGRLTPRGDLGGIVTGATIAFFAYIGFEDTVNVAEEVKDPSRVLPRAILTAIGFTCLVYAGVTIAALLTVPLDTLATSGAPLLEVLNAAGVRVPGGLFSLIALFAICNTGLLNLIMASRLSYGMAREGLLPSALARVDPNRRTPSVAVLVAFVLAAALAVSGGVQELAQTTSLLLLCVFTLLHVALLVVKRREPHSAAQSFRTPIWTPVVGAILCGGMALQYPGPVYLRMALVLLAGVALYFLFGRRRPLASAEASE